MLNSLSTAKRMLIPSSESVPSCSNVLSAVMFSTGTCCAVAIIPLTRSVSSSLDIGCRSPFRNGNLAPSILAELRALPSTLPQCPGVDLWCGHHACKISLRWWLRSTSAGSLDRRAISHPPRCLSTPRPLDRAPAQPLAHPTHPPHNSPV